MRISTADLARQLEGLPKQWLPFARNGENKDRKRYPRVMHELLGRAGAKGPGRYRRRQRLAEAHRRPVRQLRRRLSRILRMERAAVV